MRSVRLALWSFLPACFIFPVYGATLSNPMVDNYNVRVGTQTLDTARYYRLQFGP